MKDLSKEVNYDLSKCSADQLKQICDWLVKNDDGWQELDLGRITSGISIYLNYCKDRCDFILDYTNNNIYVCATTLFETNDNLDTLIADTMRKFRVLGYEIDIVIKNKI